MELQYIQVMEQVLALSIILLVLLKVIGVYLILQVELVI
jgi:hypothetical protein